MPERLHCKQMMLLCLVHLVDRENQEMKMLRTYTDHLKMLSRKFRA